MGACLMDVYIRGVHPMGVHLMGVRLMGMRFMGVCLIYEPSLRAGHGWRDRHQRCLRLLIVGDSAVRLLVILRARSAW